MSRGFINQNVWIPVLPILTACVVVISSLLYLIVTTRKQKSESSTTTLATHMLCKLSCIFLITLATLLQIQYDNIFVNALHIFACVAQETIMLKDLIARYKKFQSGQRKFEICLRHVSAALQRTMTLSLNHLGLDWRAQLLTVPYHVFIYLFEHDVFDRREMAIMISLFSYVVGLMLHTTGGWCDLIGLLIFLPLGCYTYYLMQMLDYIEELSLEYDKNRTYEIVEL
jgi:hypothetical protein